MNNRIGLSWALAAALICGGVESMAFGQAQEIMVGQSEGQGGLKLNVPANWKPLPAQSNWKSSDTSKPEQLAEFDTGAGMVKLAVFRLAGGGQEVRRTVEQWRNRFDLPKAPAEPQPAAEGEAEATANPLVKAGVAPQGQYVYIDVQGDYTAGNTPMLLPNEAIPNARLLAAIIGVADSGIYYLTMVGPKDAVAQQTDAFRGVIEAKADMNEKEIDLSQPTETNNQPESN